MASPLFRDVVVNGETIPAAAIIAEAQNHPAPRAKPGAAWKAAARALAVRTLLLQAARARGLEPQPADLGGGRRETDEEALIRAVMEQEIAPEKPTEAAIRAVYDADPASFRAPALYEPAHILFLAPPGDQAARGKARARAEAALAVLRERPDEFDALAKVESDCPSAAAGGRLGQTSPGDTAPEFEAAMADLEPGEMAATPVETRYGVHIVRLDAVAEGAALPFHAVEREIAEALEKRAWAAGAQALVNRLLADAEIDGVAMRDKAA